MSGARVFSEKSHPQSDNQCFYCGGRFTPENISREHVFPKWMQRRLNLWDKELILLNGTPIKYRNLTIPACVTCNNVVLSQVENEIAKALSGGATTLLAIGHEKLYVWLSKIFYGALYAETLLARDRADPSKGPIIPSEIMEEFDHMHFLMQSVRLGGFKYFNSDTEFHTSILVFDIQHHPHEHFRFNYFDDIPHKCGAIRIDTAGFIFIRDGGAQERLAKEVMPKVLSHQLHPIQFEEIAAKMFAKARSFNRNPAHIMVESPGGVQIIQMPLAGMSSKPIFDDFDEEVFAHLLARLLNLRVEEVWPAPNKFATWIGPLDDPKFLDVQDHPYG